MDSWLAASIKQMYKLIISKSISALGTAIYNFGMSFFILASTGSARLFSINLAIGVIFRLLIAPISGHRADTGNKKLIIVLTQFAQSFVVFCLLIYFYFFGISIIPIYIATGLMSILMGLSSPSFTSAIPNLVHNEHLQKTMGYNSTATSLSMLLGPVVGGLLYGFLSNEVFLMTFIAAYLISALIDLTLDFNLFPNGNDDNSAVTNSVFQSFKEGLGFIINHPIFSRLMLLVMLVNFFAGLMNIGMSKIVVAYFHAAAQMVGILEAAFSIGIIIGGIIIGKSKKIENPFVVIKRGLITYGMMYIMISIPLFIWFESLTIYVTFFVTGVIMGLCIQFINTPFFVFAQENVGANMRGRVFSSIELIAQILMPISFIFFGFLFDYGHYAIIYLASGILIIFVVLLLMDKKFFEKTYS